MSIIISFIGSFDIIIFILGFIPEGSCSPEWVIKMRRQGDKGKEGDRGRRGGRQVAGRSQDSGGYRSQESL